VHTCALAVEWRASLVGGCDQQLLGRGQAGSLTGGRDQVIGRELLCGPVVDEAFLQQPIDGPTLSTNIAQGVPCASQFGVVLMDQVLESPEPTPSTQGLDQTSTGRSVARTEDHRSRRDDQFVNVAVERMMRDAKITQIYEGPIRSSAS
jgi:hypothetical protein